MQNKDRTMVAMAVITEEEMVEETWVEETSKLVVGVPE
jgi:hypothetical protein